MNSTELAQLFDQKWGGFRKWIAANPLSGFWTGVALGAALLFAIAKIARAVLG